MNIRNENSIILEIQNEYRKIDNRWLNLHYHTIIGIVYFGLLIESILGMAFYTYGNVSMGLGAYIIKYILLPFLLNSCFVVIAVYTMRSSRLAERVRVYSISLLFVGVCFVFYSVHSIFESIYMIFSAPILLTVVYGEYILTTVIAFISIVAKLTSGLFIYWDPEKANPLKSSEGMVDFMLSTLILVAFYAVCMVVIRFEREKNSASIQKEVERYQMQQMLLTDALTGIYNRTALRDEFQGMEGDMSDSIYIFAMVDLDNFKKLNDTLGHEKGDQYLKQFGKILKKLCVGDSMPFRFGGDEFCILFKNKTVEEIVALCEEMQAELRKSAICRLNMPLTTSVGIARYRKGTSATELLQSADMALYRAKERKNSICVYEEEAQNEED